MQVGLERLFAGLGSARSPLLAWAAGHPLGYAAGAQGAGELRPWGLPASADARAELATEWLFRVCDELDSPALASGVCAPVQALLAQVPRPAPPRPAPPRTRSPLPRRRWPS